METSHNYLNNAWLLSGFKVGVGKSYISRGNMNSLPTAATLRITLVSFIGAMLHVYWDVFALMINTSRLTRSCPEIACVLLRNQWYFSTLFTLWLTHAKGQNVIWRQLQIHSKAPLDSLSMSTNTTATMLNDNTNSYIINLASDSDLVSVVTDDITNYVNSHIALIYVQV